eukprot:2440112-Pleurochrysis_carterae.AAC.1
MNGGVLFIRNTWWSHGFFSLWWQMRCGAHDQGPLWKLMLLCMAASSGGRFEFDVSQLGNYTGVHKYVLRHVRQNLDLLLEQSFSSLRGDPDFVDSGQLLAPLELPPRFLILPAAEVRVSKELLLPSLRASTDPNAKTFVCHTSSVDRSMKRRRHIQKTSLESQVVFPSKLLARAIKRARICAESKRAGLYVSPDYSGWTGARDAVARICCANHHLIWRLSPFSYSPFPKHRTPRALASCALVGDSASAGAVRLICLVSSALIHAFQVCEPDDLKQLKLLLNSNNAHIGMTDSAFSLATRNADTIRLSPDVLNASVVKIFL